MIELAKILARNKLLRLSVLRKNKSKKESDRKEEWEIGKTGIIASVDWSESVKE